MNRLSDAAFRLFVNSLAWSVANRTDGIIERPDADLIPRFDPSFASELTAAGLWEVTEQQGWNISVYNDTQTTRLQLEAADKKRAADRKRQAQHRAAIAAQQEQKAEAECDTPRDVTRDTTRDVTREKKGQDRPRPGQARLEEAKPQQARENGHCAVDGCVQPARNNLATCYPHASHEIEFAS